MGIVRSLNATARQALKRVLRPMLGASPSSIKPAPPEHWGLTRTASGGLAIDGLTLHGLGTEWGFPLHVVNARRLRENARRFLAVPAGAAAGCEAYYSYKTNPVPGVLSTLHAAGLGAEVISHYELWLALKLGVPPERIVYNGPAKSEASIRQAIEAGIQILNINHREEIAVVSRLAVELGRRVRVGVRVTVGDGWSGQFGVPTAGGAAMAAYEEALRSPNLDVVGLHAHRGGMIHTEAELVSFVDAVLDFSDTLFARFALALEIVNLGGSLATPTVGHLSTRDLRLNRAFHRDLPPVDPSTSLAIERYVGTLVGRVERFVAARGRQRPRIFVEPGRSVTGDAQMLVASVMTTKAQNGPTFAILDAGINLAESCRSEYHQLFSANHFDRPADHVHTIVGPICTPGDTLYWAARLPRLEAGDSVVIMDAGAYFVPFATSFSFPRPAIVMVDGGVVTLLRRAEQFDDIIGLDDVRMRTPRSPSA